MSNEDDGALSFALEDGRCRQASTLLSPVLPCACPGQLEEPVSDGAALEEQDTLSDLRIACWLCSFTTLMNGTLQTLLSARCCPCSRVRPGVRCKREKILLLGQELSRLDERKDVLVVLRPRQVSARGMSLTERTRGTLRHHLTSPHS
eukprot:755866-Hanusia_phi.AAC.3